MNSSVSKTICLKRFWYIYINIGDDKMSIEEQMEEWKMKRNEKARKEAEIIDLVVNEALGK